MIHDNYNSPYGYYDPYYSPYGYGYGNYYNPYNSYYSPYSPYSQPNTTRTELKQYIIDFESGKVLEFDIDNTELLLMKDNQLYEEYVQASQKEAERTYVCVYQKIQRKKSIVYTCRIIV